MKKKWGYQIGFWILLFLTFSMLLLSVNAQNEVDIDYWYSNSDEICRWAGTPSISYKKLNSNSNFTFLVAYSHARTQWNDGGISTISGTFPSTNVVCYGGTISEIYSETGLVVPSSDNGVTFFSHSTSYTNLNYYGSVKKLYIMSSAKVCVVDKGRTANQYKKTCTHEIGHALGWIGHSSVSTDIMYYTGSSITALTNRDINHLAQVY